MNNEQTYALLERLVNLIRAEERRLGGEAGLQPVHLHVLYYLSHANRYSDTPVAVAEYLGLTKGTASQSLIILEDHKLIVRRRDKNDRRKVHLRLTQTGKRIISRLVPPDLFIQAQKRLSDGLEAHLKALLGMMQNIGGLKTFGVCRSCRFFKSDNHKYQCGLTGEKLSSKEISQICREHSTN